VEKLNQEFQDCVSYVKNTPGGKQLSVALKLEMYALYKQVTQGDVNGDKPSAFDMIALTKYKAWEKLTGLSPETAKQQYIAQVIALRDDTLVR